MYGELGLEYERNARQKTQKQLSRIVRRELLPNGSYAPVAGIFDIGWDGWKELPAADFVRQVIELDNSITKENEMWIMGLAPMIAKGELDRNQLREWSMNYCHHVDTFAVEIVEHVFDNLEDREVRDVILRHAAEEIGHGELMADFLERGFGLDRNRDVWGSKPKEARSILTLKTPELARLLKSSPPLAYATIPFFERHLPKQNYMLARGLRKYYKFRSDVLGWFDLHSYVDIYHERFGLYVIGKYATSTKDRELLLDAVEANRRALITSSQGAYKSVGVRGI
ncbi:MAG TPA: iron-containing redox enzyme family protein [Nitrososphaerales archaeon]|nr:iron-containing redox enzyme family protein [Nitrososphaerales archaeon]